MSRIYRIHAVTNGDTAMKASRLTIDDAMREAEFLLGSGASSVWIDDRDGNPILPADKVKARVAEFRRRAPQDRFSGASSHASLSESAPNLTACSLAPEDLTQFR